MGRWVITIGLAAALAFAISFGFAYAVYSTLGVWPIAIVVLPLQFVVGAAIGTGVAHWLSPWRDR